jgi:hypothetical protein
MSLIRTFANQITPPSHALPKHVACQDPAETLAKAQ